MKKNIGKYIRTNEIKQKLKEYGKTLIGTKNPFYGKHHSVKTKLRISQKAKERDLNGVNNPFYGKIHTEEFKEKMKKPKTEEHKRKISEAKLGKKNPKLSESLKISFKNNERIPWNKGLRKEVDKRLEEYGKKISLSKKGNKLSNKRKSLSDEIKRRMRLNNEGGYYIRSAETKRKISENKERGLKISLSKKGKKFSEEHIKNLLKSFDRKPNKLELKFNEFLNKNFPNEWLYVGNGSFLIGYKNPDFINVNGKKICIEIYSNYFKTKKGGSVEEYKSNRNLHFERYGWKTIFVEQIELLNEEILKNKINNSV